MVESEIQNSDLTQQERLMEDRRLKALGIRMAVMRENALYLEDPKIMKQIEERITRHLKGEQPISLTDEDMNAASGYLADVRQKAKSPNPIDRISSFLSGRQIDSQANLLKNPPNVPNQGQLPPTR